MAEALKGIRVAFIVSNEGIEQPELAEPWKAIEKAGGRPELVAREPGSAQAFHHLVQVCTGGPSTIISSRKPADLPAFCRKIEEVFSRAHARN